MEVLTEEQFEVLSKYKDILENVLKTNSLRGAVRKNTLEIAEVLNIKNRNYSCGVCVFKIYKQAAELYFEYIKLKEESEVENGEEEIKIEEVESKTRNTDSDKPKLEKRKYRRKNK